MKKPKALKLDDIVSGKVAPLNYRMLPAVQGLHAIVTETEGQKPHAGHLRDGEAKFPALYFGQGLVIVSRHGNGEIGRFDLEAGEEG